MNSIKDYFASPCKSVPTHIPTPKKDEEADAIVLNMESVINSVKKHKKKKKKKKSDGKNETEISDISNILSNSLCFVSPVLGSKEGLIHFALKLFCFVK